MKIATRWWMAGAALAAAGLLAWAFAPRPLPVETATAQRGPFELAIAEEGRTRLRDRHVVGAPVAGRLARISLREGDAVKVGDVVARLGPLPAPMLDDRSRAGLQARVEGAQAGVARARALQRQQQVQLAQATSELRRVEALAEQGFVSDTQRETAYRAQQSARRAAEAATEGQHVAEHELAVAQAALQGGGAISALPPFEVRAPVAGQVLKVHQTSEGVVAAGTPLLELGDLAQLEIEAELLTPEALQIAPGAAVRVERWGGEHDLQATVRRIEPGGFTKVSALGVEEQRVRVLMDLTSPRSEWAALGDGFRVGVRIVRLFRPDVLRVPASAVFPAPLAAPAAQHTLSASASAASSVGDGQSAGKPAAAIALPASAADAVQQAVFKVSNGHAVLTPVSVGGRNADWAWITAGLDAGETVVLYPPAELADGLRVQPR